MKIFKIETGCFKIDGGAMFGVVPKSIWNKKYKCDEKNMVNLCMRSLLIDEGDRITLIDTGIGNKQSKKFFKHYYLNGNDSLEESLKNAGYSFDDITDVVLTHLHFDHCGGAVLRNTDSNQFEPAFKNAVYHVSKEQWNWAIYPNNREKSSYLEENFLPLLEAGVLNLIEYEQMLTNSIELRFFHGHTSGLIVPFIQFNGKTLVFTTDLIPLYGNIKVNYVCAFDIRPLEAMDEKEVFMQEAFENDYVLFFQHDIEHDCCKLEKNEREILPGKSFNFEKLII